MINTKCARNESKTELLEKGEENVLEKFPKQKGQEILTNKMNRLCSLSLFNSC